MPTVKAIPEGVQPVFPMLVCRSPEAEMNFCAAVERAIAAGVKILMPAQNQFWGDRTARILDPSATCGRWRRASRKPPKINVPPAGQRSADPDAHQGACLTSA